MRRLLRSCGATVGLGIAAIFAALAVLATAASQWPPTARDMTGVSAFALIALAGAGLAQRSLPGIFRRGTHAAVLRLRTFCGRLALSQPEGLAFWTFVGAALLLFVPVVPRLLVVLAAFVGYLIVSAVILMIGPRWWYRLLFTLIASIVIVTLLVSIAETIEPHSVGEGGLAILGPMMISWAVLPALVVLRVLFRSVRAGTE